MISRRLTGHPESKYAAPVIQGYSNQTQAWRHLRDVCRAIRTDADDLINHHPEKARAARDVIELFMERKLSPVETIHRVRLICFGSPGSSITDAVQRASEQYSPGRVT